MRIAMPTGRMLKWLQNGYRLGSDDNSFLRTLDNIPTLENLYRFGLSDGLSIRRIEGLAPGPEMVLRQ